MASGAVYQAIRDHLVATWTATPLAFENEDVDQHGNPLPPDPPVPFVEIELTGTSYGQQSIGESRQADNRWDEEGVLFLHVLVAGGAGSMLARTYAKQLADLFRGTTLLGGNLEFLDSFIGRGRPGERDGNWYLIPVDIEWRRVEA